MKLLTSQKDTLFDAIESFELSPAQFELEEIQSTLFPTDVATKMTFKNSSFFFLFETGSISSVGHYAIFSPGGSSYEETQYPQSWDRQYHCFLGWLSYLIREINSPNKWQRLQKEIEDLNITFTDTEDKFNVEEYLNLELKISSLKKEIISIGFSSDQISIINNKLDHLTDLAKSMNKFDWKSLFIGTIVSVIIQLSVTPDNAKSLWTLIKQLFSSFLLH